jgi:hypothetical protein
VYVLKGEYYFSGREEYYRKNQDTTTQYRNGKDHGRAASSSYSEMD